MLKQSLQQKLQQKLSPQQIQLMKLLQVPGIALEQRIKEELEQNPALEEGSEDIEEQDTFENDDSTDYENEENDNREDEFDLSDYMGDEDIPAYKLATKNRSRDDDDRSIPITVGKTFHEMLKSQLGLHILDETQYAIANHLIGSIDDDGYLRRDLSAITDDLAFTQNIITTVEELSSLMDIIREFDPPGVGARDLRECLLIQLKRKCEGSAYRNSSDNRKRILNIAIEIIDKLFKEFTKKHYDKIIQKLELHDEELKEAIEEILKLNPKPGNSLADSRKPVQHIIPDFVIVVNDGVPELSFDNFTVPELRVSNDYRNMLESFSNNNSDKNKKKKETILFVRQKLDSAKWFIDAIKQRQETLIKTMTALMEYQKEYFAYGDETKLKPMILKDIAEMVDMDISTISRVVSSKYVQTPYGTFLLKSFFSESMTTSSGEVVSTREIKKILDDCIAEEDKKKPLPDEKLAEILKEKGYNIARRTIAKYREQLNIPVARLRKEI